LELHSFAAYDSSRWAHFFAYVLVAAIPVAAWRYRRDVAFCLIPVILSIAFESLQTHIPGSVIRMQNISADLFGTAAGILLGLNIRMMRNSAKSPDDVNSDPSRSEMY
jgi:VanZ family protein